MYKVICVLAFALRAHCPWNDVTIAPNLWVFLNRLCRYLSWPCYLSPWMLPVAVAPMALLLWRWWREGGEFVDRFLIIAWLSVVIQAVLVSYLRANVNNEITSRYMDTFAPLLILNCAALCRIGHNRITAYLAGAWTLAAVSGLVAMTSWTCETGIHWYAIRNECWQQNTIAAFHGATPEQLMTVMPPLRPFQDESNNPSLEAMREFCKMVTNPIYSRYIPALK